MWGIWVFREDRYAACGKGGRDLSALCGAQGHGSPCFWTSGGQAGACLGVLSTSFRSEISGFQRSLSTPPLQNEQERLRKETLPLTLSTRNSESKGITCPTPSRTFGDHRKPGPFFQGGHGPCGLQGRH